MMGEPAKGICMAVKRHFEGSILGRLLAEGPSSQWNRGKIELEIY